MNFLKQNLNKKRSAFMLSVFVLVFMGVFARVNEANAFLTTLLGLATGGVTVLEKIILAVVGGLLQIVIGFVGLFIIMVVKIIITIASYNNFIHEPSIVMAWSMIRDLSNMFFILILLVIAFATILRIESYNMKKWLPKLLIMAVLINFSRTIAGLIIDFAQIFMLTFVNGIGTSGGAIISAFGVQKYLSMAVDRDVFSSNDPNTMSIILGFLSGAAFMIISLVVLTVFMVVLLIRMVMLWIYIVLSPLAFLLAAFPGGQKYSSRWWDEFIKQVITGPILIFFFWLSLVTANSFNTSSIESIAGTACFGPFEMLCPEQFVHFVVAIGMLVGGLIVTSQAGGAVGAVAGKGMGAINKGKAFAFNKTKSGTARVAKTTGRAGLTVASTLDRRLGTVVRGKGSDSSRIGLVQNVAKRTVGLPGGLVNKVKDKFRNTEEINNIRREVYENNGTYKKGGIEYEVRNNNEIWNKTDNRRLDENGRAVKTMGHTGAAYHDAWLQANGKARATVNKAQDEEIEKEKKDIADSNMSTDAALREFENAATSETRKMALAMVLAVQKGFKTNGQVKAAEKLFKNNPLMSSKFSDAIIEKQPDKAYNFSDPAEVRSFMKKMDDGKIDITKINPDMFLNEGFMSDLKSHLGKQFDSTMERISKTPNKEVQSKLSSGLLKMSGNPSNSLVDQEKYANLYAKISGDIESAFSSNTSTTGMDVGALVDFIKNSTAKDVNNIDIEVMQRVQSNLASNPSELRHLAQNISYSTLSAMQRQGDNPELVKLIKDMINNHGTPTQQAEINNDARLRTI